MACNGEPNEIAKERGDQREVENPADGGQAERGRQRPSEQIPEHYRHPNHQTTRTNIGQHGDGWIFACQAGAENGIKRLHRQVDQDQDVTQRPRPAIAIAIVAGQVTEHQNGDTSGTQHHPPHFPFPQRFVRQPGGQQRRKEDLGADHQRGIGGRG